MDNELLSESSSSSPAALHCILVHGTFAKDAKWTFSSSPLATGLCSLDPGGVRFHRFRWTGANTHIARCAAAAELGTSLRKLAAQYPSARFLLVGHSHGGNVACAAASALEGAQCAGIVTLATPFFHVVSRSLVPAALLPVMLWVLAVMSFFGLVGAWLADFAAKGNHWLYGSWAEAVGRNWLYQSYSLIVATATMLIFGFVFFILSMLVYNQVLASLTTRQEAYLRSWEQLRPFQGPTLSLSMTLDEAFWGLIWMRRLPEGLHRVKEWIHRHLVTVLAAVGIPVGLAFAVHYVRTSKVPLVADAVSMRAIGGLAWATAAAFVVMLSLWLLVVLLTGIFVRFTYGVGGIEHLLMVNVTVRRTPQIGDPSLVRHRNISLPLRQFLRDKWSLIHSKLYMDPRSTQEIVNWYRMLPRSERHVS